MLQTARQQEFLKFLRRLDQEFPGDTPLHLVMDDYGTHGTPAVKAWLAAASSLHGALRSCQL